MKLRFLLAAFLILSIVALASSGALCAVSANAALCILMYLWGYTNGFGVVG